MGDDKVPAIRGYQRVGRRASGELASKFPDAPAIGFMCGSRSRITVLDIDCKDERVLADALDRHGQTPIIVRSGSGNHQAWYKHNREGREIRPWDGRPIDLLGGGFVVAPQSRVAKGRYQLIQGSLDDLDRLPIMRMPPPDRVVDVDPLVGDGLVGKKDGDGRNAILFRLVGRAAHHADDFDQLLDYARTQNEFCAEPMTDAEVTKIVGNVWKMQLEGNNRFGRPGLYFAAEEAVPLIDSDPDLFRLISFIRATQTPGSEFMLANGMCERWKWRRTRFAAVRARAIAIGEIYCVRRASQHSPALYRRSRPASLSAKGRGGGGARGEGVVENR